MRKIDSALAFIGRWTPGVGVVRLAILCGIFGLIFSVFHYWVTVWNWADHVFWPHAYYGKIAQTPGAFRCTSEDGRVAFLLVSRPGDSQTPQGFTRVQDSVTADWTVVSEQPYPGASSKAGAAIGTQALDALLNEVQRDAAPKRGAEVATPSVSSPAPPAGFVPEPDLVTDEDWYIPRFARLRTHAPGTVVYYALLPKGSDSPVPRYYYLRFLALFAIPGLGFLLPFTFIISIAWVADGFKTQKPR